VKRALVTGAAGFCGRHMVRKLVQLGYHVTAVDLAHPRRNDLRSTSVTWLSQDCRGFFRRNGIQFDLVVHLAAIVGGRMTIEHAPLTVATDLSVDAEFFNWVVQTKQPRVIYYSSSAAYPARLQMNTSTATKLVERLLDIHNGRIFGLPDMTYGWAKVTGEFLAYHVMTTTDTRVHIFRPFSGYGSDQDLDYPFPSFIDRGLRRDDPFVIWGDGTQVRDFIHIDDIIDATFAFVDADDVGPVNLCTGIPTSFLELQRRICDFRGYRPTVQLVGEKPVGVSYRVGDPTRMLTRFTPKIGLEDGIMIALEEREPLPSLPGRRRKSTWPPTT
jgi:nucleoside-diphosphate-sugar epimerase